MSEIDTKQIILSGLFAAMAFVVPMAFHIVGLGSMFLPMFLPIVMLAYLVKMKYSVSVSIIVPIFSTLTTGMPPLYPPIVFMMIIELSLMCIVISQIYQKLNRPWYIALAVAMIVDRVILAVMIFILMKLFHIKALALNIIVIIKGLPGFCLQFLVVPIFLNLYKMRYGTYPKRN